jgi:hypothetical protein
LSFRLVCLDRRELPERRLWRARPDRVQLGQQPVRRGGQERLDLSCDPPATRQRHGQHVGDQIVVLPR